mgnify:CR=1 FL=1
MAATITCPICGKRNGYEFRYGGVSKGPRPDEEVLSPATWCDYVHMSRCVAVSYTHLTLPTTSP